jgi:hypothetical protein
MQQRADIPKSLLESYQGNQIKEPLINSESSMWQDEMCRIKVKNARNCEALAI